MAGAAGGAATGSKAEKFSYLQLRSSLDDPVMGDGAGADAAWGRLLGSGRVKRHAEPCVSLALPSSAEAEEALLVAVDALADALASPEALAGFYKRFGAWASAQQYFEELGEAQVMFVDTDHNDLDDRLAVILLAYQMASANLERRRTSPSASCVLLLDCRNYEKRGGLTVWRTLRLAARLRADLSSSASGAGAASGLEVVPVLSDREAAATLVAAYLGCSPSASDLDQRCPGVGALLFGEGACPSSLRTAWRAREKVSLWIMSGLSAEQVADVVADAEDAAAEGAAAGGEVPPRFVVFEQAQPAWQSVDVAKDETAQPEWHLPPVSRSSSSDAGAGAGSAAAAAGSDGGTLGEGDALDLASVDKGFGAEPSNIRSGEADYPDILDTYMRFQQAVAAKPDRFDYVCPALARSDGFLPVPPGQMMQRISGRPLTVLPGEAYEVKRALAPARASAAFAKLLAASKTSRPGTLLAELHQGACDDAGAARKEVAHIVKYGTFMSDAILVALAARPRRSLAAAAVVRRLAVVSFEDFGPKGPSSLSPLHVEVEEEQSHADGLGGSTSPVEVFGLAETGTANGDRGCMWCA